VWVASAVSFVMCWVESGLSSVAKGGDINTMSLTELKLAKKNLQRVNGLRGEYSEFYAAEIAKFQNQINSLSIAKFNDAQREIRESKRSHYRAKRTNYEVLEVATNLKYYL
jgi:hypothetical protein